MKRLILSALALAAVIVFLGSGCASYFVQYDRAHKGVSNIWPDTPCAGSIEVTRSHGMLHFGVDGPWREKEFYGMFFKRGTAYPEEFYFTVAGDSQTRIAESKGRVEVRGRDVMIDIQYRDQAGKWMSPPINGRHKIDSVLPDDIQPALDAAKK